MGVDQDWHLIAQDINKFDLFKTISKYKQTWREIQFEEQVGEPPVKVGEVFCKEAPAILQRHPKWSVRAS